MGAEPFRFCFSPALGPETRPPSPLRPNPPTRTRGAAPPWGTWLPRDRHTEKPSKRLICCWNVLASERSFPRDKQVF